MYYNYIIVINIYILQIAPANSFQQTSLPLSQLQLQQLQATGTIMQLNQKVIKTFFNFILIILFLFYYNL